MLGEPDRWSRGAPQFRDALLFVRLPERPPPHLKARATSERPAPHRRRGMWRGPFRAAIQSRPMKPRLLLLATAAALTCLAPAIHTPVRADARRPPSLTALVGRNALTRDTNGDGLPDSVAARVIVPSAPALADIEAATNLAATTRSNSRRQSPRRFSSVARIGSSNSSSTPASSTSLSSNRARV